MTLLRSLLFNIWFYGITLVFASAGTLLRPFSTGAAEPEWAMALARTWSSLVIEGVRVICGAEWVVTGRENLPADGAALIASMHQSAFDTLVWLLIVPRPCYVLKRELMRLPVFGLMCRLTGMIAVDRGAGASAIRSLLRGADRAVAEGRQIVIFPEGTRMPPGRLGELHPGIAALASRTRLPVIPVTTDSGLRWGRRAFRKRSGLIHVAVGAPIPAGLPRAELLARLEAAFVAGEAALGMAPERGDVR